MDDRSPAPKQIIAIGGSAGALGPLIQIAAALPSDFPASLFAVIHTPANSPGLLPLIVGRSSALQVRYAADGLSMAPGVLYIAPPDRHLLVSQEGMRLSRGPRENRARPSIDPLFRSAARAFGPRLTAVLLSGVLNDGTFGLMSVRQHGGLAIVQDPEHAEYPDMPWSAIDDVDVDHVLEPGAIAEFLKRRVVAKHTTELEVMNQDRPAEEPDLQEQPRAASLENPRAGEIAPFVCPDCGGSLWETRSGKLTRYQCHVGHAFTAEALLAGQNEELESALWAALRALQETIELSRRLAGRARDAGHDRMAQQHQEHANEMEQRAELVQRVLRGRTVA